MPKLNKRLRLMKLQVDIRSYVDDLWILKKAEKLDLRTIRAVCNQIIASIDVHVENEEMIAKGELTT